MHEVARERIPAVEVESPGISQDLRRAYDPFKRALDLLLGIAALTLLSPVLLVVALAILVVSGRPVLYRGKAVGRDGKVFDYFKFRTMVPGGEDAGFREYLRRWVSGAAMVEERDGQGLYKLARDPRITLIGRILRRASLDELPQLFNVLRGDMSLVGPRPPLTQEYALYGPRERSRLAVRPGITGLAQVTARNRLTFEEMFRLDLEYIRHRSLRLDVRILLRTVRVVVSGRGAR